MGIEQPSQTAQEIFSSLDREEAEKVKKVLIEENIASLSPEQLHLEKHFAEQELGNPFAGMRGTAYNGYESPSVFDYEAQYFEKETLLSLAPDKILAAIEKVRKEDGQKPKTEKKTDYQI